MEMTKTPLLGMTLLELKEVARALGMPAFAGGQMAKWLYQRQVKSIDAMTDISKANRQKLAEAYEIGAREPIDEQRSVDGTVKYLFPTAEGKFVETVYIPDHDRATLCVSSQVGCKMNCLFCQTGKQGFEGSLTATDILNQIYSLPEHDTLTNIVFMGQGEPMDNLDNVLRATQVLTADYGYAWSPKRITVSSVGVRNKLKRFIEESDCHVAISLHAPTHELRSQLMPAERGMGIEEVVELLRNYDFSHQRRLSFEYIVFDGVNDSIEHAQQIITLLKARLPHQPYPLPPDTRGHPAGSRRLAHGGVQRLSYRPRRIYHHPCQPRTGHLCRLRTAEHLEEDRRDKARVDTE